MVGIKDIFAQFYELAVVLAAFAFLQSHQALYVCIQLFGYERLLHIVVGSGSIACLQVFRRCKASGKEDDGIAIYLTYFLTISRPSMIGMSISETMTSG